MNHSSLHLPEGLPCSSLLGTATYPLSRWEEVKGVSRILFLNLMPQKEETEKDICGILAETGETVQVIPIKIKGQKYKTTPQEHMKTFYLDFDEVEDFYFERMIITGAPLEQMPFEDVRYWSQLCHIMHWADTHVKRTLYICWGAQAGLYYHYGVEKHPLPEKMFGIFEQNVCNYTHNANNPNEVDTFDELLTDLSPCFRMPQSRHTEVWAEDILPHASDGLHILASSKESGVGLVATNDLRRIFVTGHLEYRINTLNNEYVRDLNKGLSIQAPLHYYDTTGNPAYSWHHDAVTFYRNFVG